MRKLSLRKETLVELSSDELGGVAGGTFPSKYDCTVSHQFCFSRDVCFVSLRPCLPTHDCFHTQAC